MKGVNEVRLLAVVTVKPEMKTSQSGKEYLSLATVVNDRKKDKDSGEWIDVPTYFSVYVPDAGLAANCVNYLDVKSKVYIEAHLSVKDSKISIIADKVIFI